MLILDLTVSVKPKKVLEWKYLRADVCKYRPELGKMNFLKNPKKIM